MGKRSSFKRVERDFYPTPFEAVEPLLNYFGDYKYYFVEPCAGKYDLVNHLESCGHVCVRYSDIELNATVTQYPSVLGSCFITNPPWDRKILHPLIENLRKQKDTWLLFDADWMHTKQSSDYMMYCETIVSVGRVKWIPGSTMTGKDNCCWYKFIAEDCVTQFIGR